LITIEDGTKTSSPARRSLVRGRARSTGDRPHEHADHAHAPGRRGHGGHPRRAAGRLAEVLAGGRAGAPERFL